MSAVRRNDRRANRNTISSPYARPLKSTNGLSSKKSLWSFSGLLNFLNPFGGNGELEDSDISGPSDGEIEQGPPPRRFSPPLQQPLPPSPPPLQHQLSSHSPRPSARNGSTAQSEQISQSSSNQPFSFDGTSPAPSSSLVKNLEPVTRFLVEKAGQPLNEFEAAGIVDYIQKSVQGSTLVPDKPEPFRFSVSPSRGASPSQCQGVNSIEAPRKTLSRNPNGVYRWQGAGSSRPRNRYQSPGFAPRPQQHRIKLSPPKTPLTTDTKRRRVGEETESSTPRKLAVPSTSTIRFPSSIPESPLHHTAGSSGTMLNGRSADSSTVPPLHPATPKAGAPQPRLRTGGLATKPTTPAIPSPLRQAWKESDSPPQTSPLSRSTRAADFMTELIKEVTPTKKPDVANPYQTASPVKPPAPVRKPVTRRPKPAVKPTERLTELGPEMSAQAIIEATVPKGTKRSRPPPEMEKLLRTEGVLGNQSQSFTPVPNGPSHTIRPVSEAVEKVTMIEDEVDVEEIPSKRRRTPPFRLSPPAQEIDDVNPPKVTVRPAEVIEPSDDNAHVNGKLPPPPPVTLSPPSVTKSVFSGLKTCAPKEPSKLRYSFHADKVEVKSVDAILAPSFSSFFAPPPVPSPIVPKTAVAPTMAKLPPKEEALAMGISELPTYTFSVGTVSSSLAGPSLSVARNSVLSLAVTSLPVYEFTSAKASVRAMNGFNWTAAGMKAPISSAQTWTCSLCGLQNSADAKENCMICDAPRQVPTNSSPLSEISLPVLASSIPAAIEPPTAPSKGFDWTAAGLAPPPKPESGTWMCSVCSLSNPASATDKCSVCDTPC